MASDVDPHQFVRRLQFRIVQPRRRPPRSAVAPKTATLTLSDIDTAPCPVPKRVPLRVARVIAVMRLAGTG
jgi:hypothetical protein